MGCIERTKIAQKTKDSRKNRQQHTKKHPKNPNERIVHQNERFVGKH